MVIPLHPGNSQPGKDDDQQRSGQGDKIGNVGNNHLGIQINQVFAFEDCLPLEHSDNGQVSEKRFPTAIL
jgi:hypothetical protein